ncbi:helix-turn-helix domain-containing protein [Nocardia alni]|uniref:helix-turn-helix domain-containing protein n=1 Tax=Nocardia alni TaxID=2815723 RepID=UPI001C231483|nr:helix-turn-helix transcriptional regulator [Nocardia alni]
MVNTTRPDRTAAAILARRSLARRLRALRVDVGMSQSAGARVVDMSPQSMGRLEEGLAVKLSPPNLAALCDAYRVSAEDQQVLVALAQQIREGRTRSGYWWSAYADLCSDDDSRRIALEQATRTLTLFHTTLIPTLLQVPGYCHAVEQTAHPLDSTPDIQRRVELAARRQQQLSGTGARIHVFLLQCVLEHPIDSATVMRRQLGHLETLSKLPTMSIRVIPSQAGSHTGLHTGAFSVLEFGPLAATGLPEPPIIYAEVFPTAAYLERDEQVRPYRAAVTDIHRVALDEEHSRTLIGQIAARYR